MTWRACPFREGFVYVVQRDLEGALDTLLAGERLRFGAAAYSRYDGATIYRFIDEREAPRQWWHFDNDSEDAWRAVFVVEGDPTIPNGEPE